MPDAPVVFCFDRHYAPYAAVATASLLRSNGFPLLIHWLVRPSDISAAEQWRSAVSAPHADIRITPVEDSVFASWRDGGHVTLATYMRLLIPRVITAPKVLYLDCDIQVVGDLRPLLRADLGGAVLAGAVDHAFTGAGGRRPPFRPLCQDSYVNAGILLMNLDQMRRDDLLSQAVSIYSAHAAVIRAHDQCILNKYAEGRKALLPERWNYQVRPYETGKAEWETLLNSKAVSILHYADIVKPWQAWCTSWIRESWEALAHEVGLGEDSFERQLKLDKAIRLARALDRMGQRQLSGILKNNIIGALTTALQKPHGDSPGLQPGDALL